MMPFLDRPIGVAIIGTRFGNLHAEAISEAPDRARVLAICSGTEEHARASAERWGAELATTSYEQTIRHPGVDAVHLCVPHHLHAPMAIAAARAGKHILTEKPIATTVADADRMIDAAAKAGVLLMVSFNQRFLGHHQRAKELVDAGNVGDIFLCEGTFLGFSPIKKGWRYDRTHIGGGVLIDSGMHRIDLLRWIVGEVDTVQAVSGSYIHQGMEGEDTVVVSLRFVSGALGHITCSWGMKTPVREENLKLAGTRGTIWTENASLSVSHTFEAPPGTINPIIREAFPDVPYPDSVKRLITHFLDCLQTGMQPAVTPEDGREALRIAQAAYEAVRTGGGIRIRS